MTSNKYFIPSIALLLGLAFGATLVGLFINTNNDQQLIDTASTTVHTGDEVATSTPLPNVPEVNGPSDSPSPSPSKDPDTPVSSGDSDGKMCTMDAKLCSDGVTYVGRVAPSCAFAACPDEKPTSADEIVCTQQQKDADVCIEIYAPVCASVQVECVTAPCNPVKQTYPNSCYACREDRVISYTDGGACPGDATAE